MKRKFYIKWMGRNSGEIFEEIRYGLNRMDALQYIIDEHPIGTVIALEIKEVKE